jgi:hypothetical protein
VSATDLGEAYGAPLDDARIGRLLDLGAVVPVNDPTAKAGGLSLEVRHS